MVIGRKYCCVPKCRSQAVESRHKLVWRQERDLSGAVVLCLSCAILPRVGLEMGIPIVPSREAR